MQQPGSKNELQSKECWQLLLAALILGPSLSYCPSHRKQNYHCYIVQGCAVQSLRSGNGNPERACKLPTVCCLHYVLPAFPTHVLRHRFEGFKIPDEKAVYKVLKGYVLSLLASPSISPSILCKAARRCVHVCVCTVGLNSSSGSTGSDEKSSSGSRLFQVLAL